MEGTRLGPYLIGRELGSGGMGKVYLAEAVDRCAVPAGARVAIKLVHPHLLSEPGFFKRFLREAEIGKAVDHRNVVRCHDCDQLVLQGTAQAFLVMEYVEGQTLRELLFELEIVPEELCRHIGREVSRGLAAIHEAGVVHRDLKPENVLITPDHEVKIMDLGVARLADEAMRISKSGAFVGSVLYAAPEQFRSRGVEPDGRADLFSLGVILYEMACGSHPHSGEDFASVLWKALNEEPRPIGERNPQLSAFFEEVVHALLEKDRANRLESSRRVLEVLEQGERSTWWGRRSRDVRAATKRPLRRIRIPRETAIYGRTDELRKLSALFEQAKAGDGRVVLIEGEAGIGKSRLIDELVGRLHQDGEDLNFLFGTYPPAGTASAQGGFSTAFREHFGEAGSADCLSRTPLLVPAFDAVLRGEPPPARAVELTPASLATCFVHATRSLASERTTILLIDDIHFAPDEARDVFTSVALAVPGHRVLLIGTTRPGMPESWLANLSRLDHASHLVIDRLGPKDLGRLLIDAFRSEKLATELGLKIATKSDGNPFFVFEIIRGLREGRFLARRDDGTWVSTRMIGEIEIPSSVLDLVNARVADLSEEERDLLDVACCLGFEFDPDLVADVLGLAAIPALKRFGHVERKHRLVRSSGNHYVFDHHQVQEALYSALHQRLREHYHAALGDALEARTGAGESAPGSVDGALCVELCDHFLRGARGASALRYFESAQAHLEAGSLNASAVELAERALAVPGLLTGTARARSLLRLGGASGPLDRLGRRARQEEVTREAERLAEDAGDDGLRVRAASALGDVFLRTTRHEEAEAAFRSAIEIARTIGDRASESLVLGRFGNVFFSQGRLAEAREHSEAALALSREIGDRTGEDTATGSLGLVLFAQGRFAEALELHERHLARCRETGNRQDEAAASGNLGRVFLSQGRFADAREQFERHLTLSRETGARQGEAIATGNLGSVFWLQGRLEEARDLHTRNLALTREVGNRRGEAIAQLNLGGVLCEEEETAGAQERFVTCLALCEEIGLLLVAAHCHLTLGSMLSASGGAAAGRASLEAALATASEIGLTSVETLARCELALHAGGGAEDAVLAFTGNEERLSAGERREARYLLWRATGDRAHLEEAKRLLDEEVANVPEETRESMLGNLRVNRGIMAAWRQREA